MTAMFRDRSLALHVAAALLFLVISRSDVFAAPIVFDVTGQFENGGSLSGTFAVDTTTGVATDGNVSIDNPLANLVLSNQGPLFGMVTLLFDGPGPTTLTLFLPVTDLIGYTGGQLAAGSKLFSQSGNFELVSGSATPAPETPTVPEPTSLLLLGTGVFGTLLARRRGKR